MPPLPEHLDGQVKVGEEAVGHISIDAPGDLSQLLGWLATLPIAEVQIEPIGLQAIYEKYHRPENAA